MQFDTNQFHSDHVGTLRELKAERKRVQALVDSEIRKAIPTETVELLRTLDQLIFRYQALTDRRFAQFGESLRVLPGDHIYVDCGMYYHHGIYVGDGIVIHNSKQQQRVCQISLSAFSAGQTVEVRHYLTSGVFSGLRNTLICLPPDLVIERARSRLGDRYDPWSDNCEHFALWCKTGKHHSDQAGSFSWAALWISFGIGAVIGGVVGALLAGLLYFRV
jgi:hypothetical protein